VELAAAHLAFIKAQLFHVIGMRTIVTNARSLACEGMVDRGLARMNSVQPSRKQNKTYHGDWEGVKRTTGSPDSVKRLKMQEI